MPGAKVSLSAMEESSSESVSTRADSVAEAERATSVPLISMRGTAPKVDQLPLSELLTWRSVCRLHPVAMLVSASEFVPRTWYCSPEPVASNTTKYCVSLLSAALAGAVNSFVPLPMVGFVSVYTLLSGLPPDSLKIRTRTPSEASAFARTAFTDVRVYPLSLLPVSNRMAWVN